MTFNELFRNRKPIIGMIHTNKNCDTKVLENTQREIGIYFKYGIYPLVENYFGSEDDCEEVLAWLHSVYPHTVYGINILGDYHKAFELASKYGAKFIQIDSVCGHLEPDIDEEFAEELNFCRKKSDTVVLGGVRFKYQPVNSGRTVKEDLLIARERCDAIVCTGDGTGVATPISKVESFKSVVANFPVIVGAGVTVDTVGETILKSDGAIIGSWFKYGHVDSNIVNEEYVHGIRNVVDSFADTNIILE